MKRSTQGSALTEFVILVPLLLLVLTGLIELGKVFAELGRLSQTTFEIARRSGEVPRDPLFVEVVGFKNHIIGLNEKFVDSASADNPAVTMSSAYVGWDTDDVTDDTIEMHFRVKLNSMLRHFMDHISTSITAPYLRRSAGGQVSSQGKNPDEVQSFLRSCENTQLFCTTSDLLRMLTEPEFVPPGDCSELLTPCPMT